MASRVFFVHHKLFMDSTAFSYFTTNSPGIMLLIFIKASGHVPLQILSIEDGTVLKSFNHLLHRNKKVDFIEQFNEKLLVKDPCLDIVAKELLNNSNSQLLRLIPCSVAIKSSPITSFISSYFHVSF